MRPGGRPPGRVHELDVLRDFALAGIPLTNSPTTDAPYSGTTVTVTP
ncbi:hypothetical protein [Streptomyces sp. R08]|uniref:Uncharacterized protein n=1 Tax=Streptomyces sp. R08 TaxID=3238624 RepID=A0AB39M3U0_9ACTN